ncbi:hypothetical protein DCAR_0417070 [Daucus carota subsp. sativus]|uniref:DUF241 domain-containing protein n=1 Tax=Daucus carota subsp. sativus TaxID=79200 RepID=A0AAF0WY07_DAUCS|nr:PREDICTED: uncharacterized protein LOC108217397 [Daucus carota subsp. sativus]WOG97729.1 hypothetical protein DCAR_0417070 [Daucus carota subsp. sativus]
MSSSIVNSKTTFHSRSSSFPSKSHPLTTSVEDQLSRLRASEAASTSASSACKNLDSLQDLHQHINEVFQLPSFHRAFSQKRSALDEILEGSLRLLDFCSIAKEALLSTKESIQVLQSSLRRKSRETGLTQEVMSYMASRKKILQLVSKSMKSLINFEKNISLPFSNEDADLEAIVNMAREVQAVSFSVLKSVLSHVSDTKATSKQSGWLKVSKFMQSKRVSSDTKDTEDHEVKKIDEALNALTVQKSCKDINTVQNVLKQLQTLECSIQELEEGLEPIFRCLLNTRVTLLNVLNH